MTTTGNQFLVRDIDKRPRLRDSETNEHQNAAIAVLPDAHPRTRATPLTHIREEASVQPSSQAPLASHVFANGPGG